MEKDLLSKTAIVTGAASGIGEAAALLYALHGAKVVVSDINETKSKKLVEKIKKNSGEAIFVKTDVSDAAQCKELVDKTSIVNNSSILGSAGFANAAGYVAAKHGIVGLTQTAAIEYSKNGIRVNAIGPGFINTPLLSDAGIDKEGQEALVQLHPIGRLGESNEVAELVIWLSSDKASFVTGSYYPVDGGYLAP